MRFKPAGLAALMMTLAAALHAEGALAGDAASPLWSIGGFGTLGAVHSSERQADFTSSIFKPTGAGYSGSWSADVDSLIGAQLTANPAPRLSAVLQVIIEQTYDDRHRPYIEWANIAYQFTPELSIRVGRSVLPMFLFSEVRKVGYAHPWARPPLEVYALNALTSSDGIDASYRMHRGELTYTVQANSGSKSIHLAGDSTAARLGDLWGISHTIEHGALTAHAFYQQFFGTVPTANAFFDNFRQFGSQGAVIADKYDASHKRVNSFGLGASYDPGAWFLMTEWGRNNTRSYLGRSTAWYVSGGYQFGRFTPFVIYAQARANNLADPGLELGSLPDPLVQPATQLNAALNTLLSARTVQDTVSIGGRQELTRNASLKVQLDHTRLGAGSSGQLINIQPGFGLGGQFTAISVNVDFVF
ncbi:MAG: hypothetical protein ABW278_16655 [Steroidobacteraceae bacterium]